MITEYDDLKLDLSTAQGLLDDSITDADSWELYALIEMREYEAALLRLRTLAEVSGSNDAAEFLAEIAKRARLTP
jgi:hypothetical protein